ncbi:hypothetical protein BASA81_006467 [Batrachochytrium salamandrivorans]|nr:hypothetical protein BASA81_006467 [Batrachochytrium salamandrivorans]
MNFMKRISLGSKGTSSIRSKPGSKPNKTPEVLTEAHHELDDTWTSTTDSDDSPFLVQALFEFSTQVDGDLAFAVDQVIRVTMKDDLWYLGWYVKLDGTEAMGVFPQTYVKALPADTVLTNHALPETRAVESTQTMASDSPASSDPPASLDPPTSSDPPAA